MTRTVRLFYHHRAFKGIRKATRKGKKSKQGFEVTRGNGTRNLVLTDFASLGLSLLYSKIKLYG